MVRPTYISLKHRENIKESSIASNFLPIDYTVEWRGTKLQNKE